MPILERAILLLGVTVLTAPGLVAQDCAALTAEHQALQDADNKQFDRYVEDQVKAEDTYRHAEAKLQALEGTTGNPSILAGLMSNEDFSAAGMRKFKDLNQLPPSLDTPINGGRPAEFWRGAIGELKRRMGNREEQFLREHTRNNDRLFAIVDQRRSLGCDQANTGPIAIRRNSAGLPVITDALLTRWFRGYRAMQNGGAYWQAAQMGQQDFAEVNQRVGSYTIAACKPEGAARADGVREWLCRTDPVRATLEAGFTSDELAVFDARRSDMEAALSGNWSAVRM
jgi:hypothetical protein